MTDFTTWRYVSDGSSAIPDTLIDNYEDADADPTGPYEETETISDYYTITAGSFGRTTTNAIKDSKSLERTSASGSTNTDAMMSFPGDGLFDYPEEGETVSLIIDENAFDVAAGVLAGCDPNIEPSGYALSAVDPNNWRIDRLDGGGSINEGLDTDSTTVSLPVEIVIKPPKSGKSTVEGSVWSLDANLERESREITMSATESTYAGNRGVGVLTGSTGDTGTFADELRFGRGV